VTVPLHRAPGASPHRPAARSPFRQVAVHPLDGILATADADVRYRQTVN